jgi:outer membrane receptor protein involved in Fe transport
MLSVSVDWSIADLGFAQLTAYVQANWQSEWYETALWQAVVSGQPVIYDHQVMDERTIVNGRINLEGIKVGDGTLRASLWGRNLTDDDYPTFGINYGGLGPIAEQYGAPRMWGIDVTYEY